MTREYVLVDIKKMPSKMNGGMFYRLTWACLDDMTRWETDVQENYRNWLKNGWCDIVDNKRYGVYTNLQRSSRQNNRKVGVVTADSYPECIIPIDTQELAVDVVVAEQQRIADQNRNTMFDSVFVTE
jgi:hypothetical protein